ncbi:MAG: hypothetical protein ABEJ76_04030 [Halanaeroarchaeum sp.]
MGLLEIHFHDSDVGFTWEFAPTKSIDESTPATETERKGTGLATDGPGERTPALIALLVAGVGIAVAIVAWRRRS